MPKYNETTSVSQPTERTTRLSPIEHAGQASVGAFIGGILVVMALLVTGVISLAALPVAGGVILVLSALGFLVLAGGSLAHLGLYVAETLSNRDINGDDYIGDPNQPRKEIQLVPVRHWQDEPSYRPAGADTGISKSDLRWLVGHLDIKGQRGCNSRKGKRTPEEAGMVLLDPIQIKSKSNLNPNQADSIMNPLTPTPTPSPLSKTSSGGSADPTLEGYLSVSVAQFSNRIHLIGSSTQRDEIEDRLKELYGRGVPEWFEKAIKEAEDQNKRNWSYVRAILDRCLREGIAPDVKASTNGHAGGVARVPRGNRGLEALRLVQEEERRQANGEQ